MRIILRTIILSCFVLLSSSLRAQDLILSGYSLYISDSSSIYIPGQLQISSSVFSDPIYLDGKIFLKGNLVNNSATKIFADIESVPK